MRERQDSIGDKLLKSSAALTLGKSRFTIPMLHELNIQAAARVRICHRAGAHRANVRGRQAAARARRGSRAPGSRPCRHSKFRLAGPVAKSEAPEYDWRDDVETGRSPDPRKTDGAGGERRAARFCRAYVVACRHHLNFQAAGRPSSYFRPGNSACALIFRFCFCSGRYGRANSMRSPISPPQPFVFL
jgi:hypothetical protein